MFITVYTWYSYDSLFQHSSHHPGRLPDIVIHAVCSVLLVLKNTLDHFVISYLNFKMNLILQEKEIVEIIDMARGQCTVISIVGYIPF